MPINLSYLDTYDTTQKNPIDVDLGKTVGVALPIDDTNLFKFTPTFTEQAKTNIINILLTEPGERINLPTFGLGLRKLLFEQNIDLETLKINISNQLAQWAPQIKIFNVRAKASRDRHKISITITYAYILDGSVDSITVNFS